MWHSLTRFALALLAPLLLAAAAFAQARYLWSRSDDGIGHGNDSAQSIALSPDGVIYVAASSDGANDSDVLVSAFDAYGRLLWRQRLDAGGVEYAVEVVCDANQAALDVLGLGFDAAGLPRCVLWRIDSHSGSIVWQEIYSGPMQQGARGLTLVLDSNGGLLVGGYVGTTTQHDAIVTRFDSAGAVSWEWSAPTPGSSQGGCPWIVKEASGDILVRFSEALQAVGDLQTVHRLTSSGAHLSSFVLGASSYGAFGPYVGADSNLVYAINAASGGEVIAKLDHAGNRLWSIDAHTLWSQNSSTRDLALDTQGDVVALGDDGKLVRLDPTGSVRWQTSMNTVTWFDPGGPRHLELARNGDEVLLSDGETALDFLRYSSVARWDVAGNFLWSQSVRERDPGTQVRAYAMSLAPEGSIVLAGNSQARGSATTDQFVAALHQQSHTSCFGDGSFGACPCNNNSTPGSGQGCKTFPGFNGVVLDDQGIASLGSDSLRFYVEGYGLLHDALVLLLQGAPSATATPLQDGLACFAGSTLRLCSGITSSGYVDFPPQGAGSISARAAALGDPIGPGSSRAYQIYFRGPSSVCGAGNGNLTNSVVVDWAP